MLLGMCGPVLAPQMIPEPLGKALALAEHGGSRSMGGQEGAR